MCVYVFTYSKNVYRLVLVDGWVSGVDLNCTRFRGKRCGSTLTAVFEQSWRNVSLNIWLTHIQCIGFMWSEAVEQSHISSILLSEWVTRQNFALITRAALIATLCVCMCVCVCVCVCVCTCTFWGVGHFHRPSLFERLVTGIITRFIYVRVRVRLVSGI